ncbi:MAG: NADH-dependent phenylglyoxylate dehydrogenase subunit epsilon [Gammaproteobacteria bacterium]|nr:NADH-dependent phenylglyoxylate dehydrogenase subunit epsilon [Gammaproteobacteria bacterium]
MHHVVIGAGPAGVVAAEHLRKYDPDSSVTIVGGEEEPPYSRMAIPYYLVKRIPEGGTHLRKSSGYYDRMGIDVKHGRVTGVDTNANAVSLDGGGSVNYDKLLIATGASPVAPPIPGTDLDGVRNCWDLPDAREIIKYCEPGKRIVLIGAGFIGCIILEALVASGAQVHVVEMENRMVPRMMNETAGGLIGQWCGDKGIEVHTGTRVESIDEKNGALSVSLGDGGRLDADLAITATGVAPNIGFARDSGIDVDEGLLVNEYLQTRSENVYAAGDCAQGRDFSTGEYSVQAIQPTAVEHGRIAARNMARGHEHYHWGNVNMNVLDTMGLISSSFGLWMGADGGDSAELLDKNEYRYLNLQFKDDVLVGASSLGLTEHVGVVRGLIQSKTRLKNWKDKLRKDPTRLMEAYLANTQAVGHNAHVL